MLAAMLAFRNGCFSLRLPSDWKGIEGQVAAAFNDAVSCQELLSREVERVGEFVGRQGQYAQRMSVPGAIGGWAAQVNCLNALLDDLIRPTTEVSRMIGAVRRGDLGQSMELEVNGRPLRGESLRSARLVNAMIEELAVFTSEVTRVAREVGAEGKLGGQAQVPAAAGAWKELTCSVNRMADNLTAQVRNIAEVTIAVANGDLSRKITADVRGEMLELKGAANTMVDQLRSFSSEVTRVAREVGTDGVLGGQAKVMGVAGTWKDLTDSVNAMATNLTSQVRNIAQVTTAVARGDLSRKITVNVKGELLELKETVNTMLDQLQSFSSEVTRVAREVGTEGRLGGQAEVPGVAGTWKDLTDSVNFMASNLTGQVRDIADVTTAVAKGDLSRKIAVHVRGEMLELKNAVNTMVDQLRSFASEVTRVAREVGTEGRLGVQAVVPGASGTWKDLTESVNTSCANLTAQVRNIAEVTTAVARGDLSRKITVDVKGEILDLKDTINGMVDQLSAFAGEVSRVAREVGTEGKLGGQAQVAGAGGVWKDLTDNVNFMASNLTEQVRGIVRVVTAVAEGNLNRRLAVQAKGEIAALADTINNMIDTLAIFADQVTNVAREVGVEGRLGGQAHVPGAAGTWKDLTANVNMLAANLTSQVRAIADVATAVTHGDLTRSIEVEARGEVVELKDNINTMIYNLRETTRRNREQDWLKTNLARFAGMLQGQRDLVAVGRMLLSELSPLVSAHRGAIYGPVAEEDGALQLLSSYAHSGRPVATVRPGEGLVGQCAVEKKRILLKDVSPELVGTPPLADATCRVTVIVLPVLFENEIKAVIELVSAHRFSDINLAFLDQLAPSIGAVFNTIEATMRTERLLAQSQQLTAQFRELNNSLEQRVAERTASLDSSTRRLRAVFDGTFEYMWLIAPDGSLLEANRSALDFIGCDLESVMERPFWDTPWFQFTPGAEDIIRRATARAAAGDQEHFEIAIHTSAGDTRTVDISFRPLRDEEGNVILIVPAGLDITARVLAEGTARRLAAVVEYSDDAILSEDLNGVIRTFNHAAEQFFGYKADEIVGKSVAILIPRDRQHEEPDIIARIRRGEPVDHYETVRRRKDGSLVDVSLTVSPVCDDNGRIVGASKIARDITERKLAEARLRDSERQLQELIAAIPAAIYTTDAEGRITYFNQAAVDLAGRIPTIGSDEWCVMWRLYRPDGTRLPYDQSPMALALREGRAIRNAEAVAERPDGSRVPFIPYPTPLRDGERRIVGAINMLVDISERKQAETQQRILLNELNHRVKNNMQMLQTLLEASARRTESPEAQRVLEEASSRITAMAAAQRVLYTTPDATRFNAHDFLATVCESAAQAFPFEVDIDCEADAIQLSNDAAMPLALIANELLTNGIKYGLNEHRGTIRVRLKREDDEFLFYVEDDGPGFQLQAVQQRWSGLALVQGLARQLRGRFEVIRTPATRCSVRFR